MEPLISVVMPVYNGGKYLQEAIESILNQTEGDFEFIIINDGSTDDSAALIDKYRELDSRIKVITQENKGLISSLNTGIDEAKGKYIARMDADDVSLPERFRIQLECMEKNPKIGACGSWAKVFGEGKNHLIKHPLSTKELKPKLLFSVCFAHPTVMLRKNVLLQHNLRYSLSAEGVEDYELWTRLINVTEFANIQKILLKYRYVVSSISRLADSAKTDKRYNQLKSVFSLQLEKLGMVNSDFENSLHYIVLSGERLSKTEINLADLDLYFRKIINANYYSDYCDKSELLNFLSTKFLVAFYYQFQINKFNIVKVLNLRFLYISIKCKVMHYFRRKLAR